MYGAISAQARRPDLTLQRREAGGLDRILLVECRWSLRDGDQGSRRALADLLGCRREFGAALDLGPESHGLGLAWGLWLAPRASAEVMLCSPEHIRKELSGLVT